MKKNGFTSAGKVRWRCRDCGASESRSRPDTARKAEFAWFLDWLMSREPQAAAAPVSARTLRRRTDWCWRVEPVIPRTGEAYPWLQLDGIYLDTWCCLIATGLRGTAGWQWCDHEKRVAWEALLRTMPAPEAIVCDGGAGLVSAVAAIWPHARIQRCLVHVERDIARHLTRHPKTNAGQELLTLAGRLPHVRDVASAAQWAIDLHAWHTHHHQLTSEKTYRGADPGQDVPSYIKPEQRWWYTHIRLRRAYLLLEKLHRQGHLFTFLDPALAHLDLPWTTNRIEGGVNRQLRELLTRHRGMPEHHQTRAADWWLWLHWADHPDPHTLIQPRHITPPATPASTGDDAPSWTSQPTPEEGLWTRKGWAGRSR